MTKAIVFDFDGVLGDTWDTAVGICRDLNMDFTIDDFKDHHNGNVFKEPKLPFTKKLADDYYSVYIDRVSEDNLFPLRNELNKLVKKYKLFVISSNGEEAIKRYFKLGKWNHYFSGIFGADTDKSKVVKFKKIFKDYNLKPNECIFVTDTLGDLIEGEKAGVKTLAVTWGFHGEIRLKKGNPTKIIHDFDELADTIKIM